MRLLPIVLPLMLPGILAAQVHPGPSRLEVVPGIYLFRTPPYNDVGLDGNAVAIVSNDGVLVFDANGTPAAAAAVLAGIREVTAQPVRYLVLSHWHWDHWYGAQVYREAYPGIQIITQATTRELMLGPALAFNEPGIESQLPGHIQDVSRALAAARAKDPASPDVPRLEQHIAADQFFLDQKRGVHHTVANLTFTDSLTIYLGEREVRVLHYDRAITPGDAFLYLPRERLLVSGDLLINPITFALDCYPAGWLRTLDRINALDVSVIIPGHGAPMSDKVVLQTYISLLTELQRQAKQAKASGLDVEQARAAVADSVRDLRVALTGDDPGLNEAFDVYLVDWFLHRAYEELNGPLTNEIEPIPSH